jgi:hypothetical protein
MGTVIPSVATNPAPALYAVRVEAEPDFSLRSE